MSKKTRLNIWGTPLKTPNVPPRKRGKYSNSKRSVWTVGGGGRKR